VKGPGGGTASLHADTLGLAAPPNECNGAKFGRRTFEQSYILTRPAALLTPGGEQGSCFP